MAMRRRRRQQRSTDAHKKDMWAGQSKFLVVVRVRPINEQERRTSKDVTRVLDEKVVIVRDPASDSKDILRANRAQDRRYAFDHAFGPHSTQQYVYDNTTRFVVEGVLNGFNATVFAYGATGAGKTYTMLGNMDQPGLMVLTLTDLFAKIEEWTVSRRLQFKVMLTYIEVYNELIRDLLTPDSDVLDLREDPIKGPTVAGVTELLCTSTEDVMVLLRRGNKQRTQEPTAANKESSRSHAVLQISVEQMEHNGESKKVGKLSMVDLAGSERAAKTTNSGIRLKEGANINRSLLALGNCINALTSGGKGSYVPYRDSKLTRMLKDSLGGNCRTVMIANVSPAASCFDETLNTLKYANRAKKIKTNVSRNVLNVNYHISEYENLISGLRNEISVLKNQLARHGGPSTLGARQNTQPSRRGERESQAMNSLRNDLVDNFKERMQLRRSLIDLQAQNIQNNIEIQRRRQLISAFEQKQAEAASLNMDPTAEVKMDPEFEARVDQARQEVRDYMRASMANKEQGELLQDRLVKNEAHAKAIRDKLHTRITSDERKELLNLEYRIGLLELDNMELEHSRLLHEQVVKQRDIRVKQLLRQLEQRDKIIEQMRQALEDAGLGDLVDEDALGALQQPEEMNDVPFVDFVPQRHDAQRPFSPSAKASKMPHAAAVNADDLVLVPVNDGSPHHSPINMSPRGAPASGVGGNSAALRNSQASPIFSPANAWTNSHVAQRRGSASGAGVGAGGGAGAGAQRALADSRAVSLPALTPDMQQVANNYDLPAKNPYYAQRPHVSRSFNPHHRPSNSYSSGDGGGGDGSGGNTNGNGNGQVVGGSMPNTLISHAHVRTRGGNRAPVNGTDAPATGRSHASDRSNGYASHSSSKYDTNNSAHSAHSDPVSRPHRRRPRARPHMPRSKRPARYRSRKGGGRTNVGGAYRRGDKEDARGMRRRRKRPSITNSPYKVTPTYNRGGRAPTKYQADRLRRHVSNQDADSSPDVRHNPLSRINARMARIHPAGVPPGSGLGGSSPSSGSEEEAGRGGGLSVVGRNARGRRGQQRGRRGGGVGVGVGVGVGGGGDVQVHNGGALFSHDGPEADPLDDFSDILGPPPPAAAQRRRSSNAKLDSYMRQPSPTNGSKEPAWRAKFNNPQRGGQVNVGPTSPSKLPFLSSPSSFSTNDQGY